MDIRTIYIVYNEDVYDYETVSNELMLEGYRHNFYFSNIHGYNENNLQKSDEIWLFGACSRYLDVIKAREIGIDEWQMG
jgi:hypothetical protein